MLFRNRRGPLGLGYRKCFFNEGRLYRRHFFIYNDKEFLEKRKEILEKELELIKKALNK